MTPPTSSPTRDIARAAVRTELAEVAFRVYVRDGYDKVTLNDVAVEAGVSRSTFLRYFKSKEDPVLYTIDAERELVAASLRERPATENDWTSLRWAMEVLTERYREDPAAALALCQLVIGTPMLHVACRGRQLTWRPALADALIKRSGSRPTAAVSLVAKVRATAAIGCWNVASEHWSNSNGRLNLAVLLRDAFGALAPQVLRASDRP